MADTISPAGSLQGYSFKSWIKGTKESVKTLIMAGAGVGTYFITSSVLSPELRAGLVALSMAAAKWLVDFIDFYTSDVQLSSPPQ